MYRVYLGSSSMSDMSTIFIFEDEIQYKDYQLHESMEKELLVDYQNSNPDMNKPFDLEGYTVLLSCDYITDEHYCVGTSKAIVIIGDRNEIPLMAIEYEGRGCICMGNPPYTKTHVENFSSWFAKVHQQVRLYEKYVLSDRSDFYGQFGEIESEDNLMKRKMYVDLLNLVTIKV
jgi:hypothetical protein